MRKERMDGIASAHRNDSIEENLKHFAEMTAASPEGLRWCLRAKLSVDDNNKALRDPVIYRCNTLPHHRTGCVPSGSDSHRSNLMYVLGISGKFTPPTISRVL